MKGGLSHSVRDVSRHGGGGLGGQLTRLERRMGPAIPSVKGRIVSSALQAMGSLLRLLDSAQHHKSRLDTNEQCV